MDHFFFAHFFKHLRGGGIGITQAFGELPVNPAIFFFGSNGQGQNFLFGQISELFLCHFVLITSMGKKNRTNRENKSPTGNVVAWSYFSLGLLGATGKAAVSEKQ